MANFSLRNIDDELLQRLRHRAAQEHTSINKLVLRVLRKDCGLDTKGERIYRDASRLAGQWSRQEADQFIKNTELFEQIDDELWQ